MAFKPPKASTSGGYSVSQEIDLKEIFGIDFKEAQDVKELIGEAIIKRIRERTESGTGIRFNGDKASTYSFKKYSKEYKESPEFKAFGKSDKVNLRLSGDMLELMNVIEDKGNKIVIGWDDTIQNAKAYNHTTGDTVPERPFFGVSKSELKEIVSQYKSDIKKAVKASVEGDKDAVRENLSNLIDDLDGE